MLNEKVRQFIEDNIEIIERNDVSNVFSRCPFWLIPDLIEALKDAKIDTRKLEDKYLELDSKWTNIMKLKELSDGLILSPLTRSDLREFEIDTYNSFTKPKYFCIDTGSDEQVVFAMEPSSGLIFVEEDTDFIGIGEEYDSPMKFIKHYRDLVHS